jgi:hypothetical protein
MTKLSDYLNAINHSKTELMDSFLGGLDAEEYEKNYPPFVINKSLSYFVDTVFQANEMNRRYHLDNKLQFSYLLNSIRPKKRFSRWLKPEKFEYLDIVKEYFGYSNEKAKEAIDILTQEQLLNIAKKLDKGGVEK